MIQKLRVAFRLMWRHRLLTVGFFAAAAARAELLIVFLWLIKTFLGRSLSPVEGASSEAGWTTLAGVGGLIFGCWVARSISDYYTRVVQTELGRRVEMQIRLNLVEHVLRLSVGFFGRSSKGDILRAVHSDASSLRVLVHHTCGMIISVLQIASLFFLAFTMDPELTIWGLLAMPFVVFPLARIGAAISRYAKQNRFHGIAIVNLLLQVLSGIRIVKIFEGEEREAKACLKSARGLLKAAMGIVKRQALAGVMLDSLSGFGIFFVIMLGGARVSSGQMNISTFIAFILALQLLLGSTRQLLNVYVQVKVQSVAIDKIDELMAVEPDIKDAKDAVGLDSPPNEIRFEKVCFSYDEEPILSDIDFAVKRGETIGIVGPSGVGKTTLLNLAARFYDPDRGRILFDGTDITRIKLKHLMRNLAIVTQEPFLFQVSAMENIRYGRPDASDEDVYAAAVSANIHDDIVSWKDGYDTVIGPRGTDVSVGQKQRINIARAVLKNAPILLLDEATSALDSSTEMQVQEALEGLMRKCTTLVIAHRLSTLRKADKIAVLADGKLEAFAPHEALMRSSPTYQELWEAQQRPASSEETS